MLTIIMEDDIIINPTRIYIHIGLAKNGINMAQLCAWPTIPRGLKMDRPNAFQIITEMPKEKIEALYKRIADQVAAGVTVIDLRKMGKEEG